MKYVEFEIKKRKKCRKVRGWGSLVHPIVLPRTSARTHRLVHIWGSWRKKVEFKTKKITPPNTPRCLQQKENMQLVKEPQVRPHLSEEEPFEHIVGQRPLLSRCRWIISCYGQSRTACSVTMRPLRLIQDRVGCQVVSFLGLIVVMTLILLELGINPEDMTR